MTTILDTLNYTDIPTALSMTTTISENQTTIIQLKEDMETMNKSNSNLTNKLEKSYDSQKALVRTNNEMKIDTTNREQTLQKEIDDLTAQLEEERKQIDERDPQVKLFYMKLEHLLPMGKAHCEICTRFTPLWKEYYDKYKQDKEEKVE